LYANTTWNLRNATLVDVLDRDVNGIQIALHLNVTVHGVVTLDGDAPRVNALVRFSPFDPDGKTAIDDDPLRPRDPRERDGARIGTDGKFSAKDNPWGRYAIRIIGLSSDAYIDEVQQGGVNVYDAGINVTTDAFRFATDQITVKVKSNGGRIEGIVQTSDRKPLSTAVVLVPPAARRRNPSLYLATRSDADGRFSLRGIQPGEYQLFAWESAPEGAWQNAEFLAGYESQGRAVSIAPSVSTQVEIVAVR
jgi:hypothetical protein